MILINIVLCFVMVCFAAYYALPADVRILVGENCRNSRGRLKPLYVLREFFSVGTFFAQFLFAASLIASVGLCGLVLVDDYIKLDIVKNALAQAELDPAAWENNLKTGPNSIQSQFTHHHMMRGGTRASARVMMLTMWGLIPFATVLCFISLLLYLRVMSKSYNDALRDLVREEVARDLNRIRERYLRSSAQLHQQILQRQEAHPTWTER